MTVSTRILDDIATEMAATAARSGGDPEVAHGRADDLLIETIRWLAAGEPRHITDLVDKVVADYNRLRARGGHRDSANVDRETAWRTAGRRPGQGQRRPSPVTDGVAVDRVWEAV